MSTSDHNLKRKELGGVALPPTWSDRLYDWVLPQWFRDQFKSSKRQMLSLERQIQRRFKNEYRAQMKEFEPILRARGVIVGEVVLDTLRGASAGKISYAEAVSRTVSDSFVEVLPVRELMQTLDPLITPILTPFVDGIKSPIYGHLGEIENKVKLTVVGVGIASALLGFSVGAFISRPKRP